MLDIPLAVQALLTETDVVAVAETVQPAPGLLHSVPWYAPAETVTYTEISLEEWYEQYIKSGQHLQDWHRLVTLHRMFWRDSLDEPPW